MQIIHEIFTKFYQFILMGIILFIISISKQSQLYAYNQPTRVCSESSKSVALSKNFKTAGQIISLCFPLQFSKLWTTTRRTFSISCACCVAVTPVSDPLFFRTNSVRRESRRMLQRHILTQRKRIQ